MGNGGEEIKAMADLGDRSAKTVSIRRFELELI